MCFVYISICVCIYLYMCMYISICVCIYLYMFIYGCISMILLYFQLAIAGAPVVNWSLYDTAYTERFMGTPQENKRAYDESSVLEYVDCLPNS